MSLQPITTNQPKPKEVEKKTKPPAILWLCLGILLGLILSFIYYTSQNPYFSSNRYHSVAGDLVVFSNTAPGPVTIPAGEIQVFGTSIKAQGSCDLGNHRGILIQFKTSPNDWGDNKCLDYGTYILVYRDGSNTYPPAVFAVSSYWLPKKEASVFFKSAATRVAVFPSLNLNKKNKI